MQLKFMPGSRFFITDYSTHYDAVIIPEGVTYRTPFYARRKVNTRWYTLYVNGGSVNDGKMTSISYEDPHGRSEQHGVIDIVEGSTLVMTRPAAHGGGWALYKLAEDYPEQIDANPLPVDARRIAFLGYTEDGTKRLLVVTSKFHPEHTRVYAGSVIQNVLSPTEDVTGEPVPTQGGALFTLQDGSEMLISLNTGLPCVYKSKEYHPVDPAAYSVEETHGGAVLRRTQ